MEQELKSNNFTIKRVIPRNSSTILKTNQKIIAE